MWGQGHRGRVKGGSGDRRASLGQRGKLGGRGRAGGGRKARYQGRGLGRTERPCAQPGTAEAPEVERLGMNFSKVRASPGWQQEGGSPGPSEALSPP